MIGGRIIENVEVNLNGRDVRRLWIMDSNGDECCVYAETGACLLACGERIWWQSAFIYARGDTLRIRKIGWSFTPQHSEEIR